MPGRRRLRQARGGAQPIERERRCASGGRPLGLDEEAGRDRELARPPARVAPQ
jgi:hypothetical protein